MTAGRSSCPSWKELRGATGPAGAVAVFAVAFALATLPAPALAGSSLGWTGASLSWTNGMVLCIFDNTIPSVSVSALGLNDSGLSSSLTQIDEVRSNGTTVATAAMANTSWTRSNASSDAQFDMAYQSHVAIMTAGSAAATVGSVDIRVDYRLPAYDGSTGGNPSSVTFQLLVSNWTWQASGDQLVISIPLWPTFASEHLSGGSSPGPVVTSWANSTGSEREYFQAGSFANATTSTGTVMAIPVAPSVNVQPGFGSVALKLGALAGEFQSASYLAHIGIHVPATIAGIPLYDFALVGAGAGVISVIVAVGTRTLRRRPSDLTYVEEP